MDTHISSARQMPPVEITIAVNQSNFTIRIADRGRGKSNLQFFWFKIKFEIFGSFFFEVKRNIYKNFKVFYITVLELFFT